MKKMPEDLVFEKLIGSGMVLSDIRPGPHLLIGAHVQTLEAFYSKREGGFVRVTLLPNDGPGVKVMSIEQDYLRSA